jgi:hypothetical protein
MILEHVDRRVLGAVSFLDATTRLRINSPLEVEARGVRLVRNRRSIYVITRAPGLRAYTDAFAQQPTPPAAGAVPLESTQVELRISDPAFQYVPRRFALRLPRDPITANANQAGSLFRPIEVSLFPSPAASVAPGWALIRATVREAETNSLLPWSLLRVMSTDAEPRVLALGVADNRGEALVAVPGIPLTTFGEDEDEVVATEIDVRVEVVFDPGVRRLDDLEALRAGDDPNEGYVPDPDALNGEEASDSFDLTLASGRVLIETLLVDLSP